MENEKIKASEMSAVHETSKSGLTDSGTDLTDSGMSVSDAEMSLTEPRSGLSEVKEYLDDEEGLATVEVVLILLVLIALVLIFKKQITKVLKNLMSKVSSQSDGV